jgi:hypothetical protein
MAGIEPAYNCFADSRLTVQPHSHSSPYRSRTCNFLFRKQMCCPPHPGTVLSCPCPSLRHCSCPSLRYITLPWLRQLTLDCFLPFCLRFLLVRNMLSLVQYRLDDFGRNTFEIIVRVAVSVSTSLGVQLHQLPGRYLPKDLTEPDLFSVELNLNDFFVVHVAPSIGVLDITPVKSPQH